MSSTRELITISAGQCGLEMAYTQWQNYCVEHDINEYGQLVGGDLTVGGGGGGHGASLVHSVYHETSDGRFVPRNICVDTDIDTIEMFQRSRLGCIFDADSMVSCADGIAGTYSRGHYTAGKMLIDEFSNQLRLAANSYLSHSISLSHCRIALSTFTHSRTPTTQNAIICRDSL